MHGKVISLSRGLGTNRRRLFALVDHGEDAVAPSYPRFELSACDPDDEGRAWVAVRGPAIDKEFIRLAKLAGWNEEFATLAPPRRSSRSGSRTT